MAFVFLAVFNIYQHFTMSSLQIDNI